MVTVTIKREKQYPTPGRSYRVEWKWHYTWTADDGSHLVDYVCPDGTERTGVNIGSFGNGLGDLRDMLRRKYGRGVKLVETWKVGNSGGGMVS